MEGQNIRVNVSIPAQHFAGLVLQEDSPRYGQVGRVVEVSHETDYRLEFIGGKRETFTGPSFYSLESYSPDRLPVCEVQPFYVLWGIGLPIEAMKSIGRSHNHLIATYERIFGKDNGVAKITKDVQELFQEIRQGRDIRR